VAALGQIALFFLLVLVPIVMGIVLIYKATSIFHYSSTTLLVQFMQTSGLFLSFNLNWDSSLFSLLHSLSVFNLDVDFFATECAFTTSRSFHGRFIMTMLVPIFVCTALFTILYSWQWLCQRFPDPFFEERRRRRKASKGRRKTIDAAAGHHARKPSGNTTTLPLVADRETLGRQPSLNDNYATIGDFHGLPEPASTYHQFASSPALHTRAISHKEARTPGLSAHFSSELHSSKSGHAATPHEGTAADQAALEPKAELQDAIKSGKGSAKFAPRQSLNLDKLTFENLVRVSRNQSLRRVSAFGIWPCARVPHPITGEKVFAFEHIAFKRLRDRFIDAFMLFIILAHIPLAHTTLGYFGCYETPDRSYMVMACIQAGHLDHADDVAAAVCAIEQVSNPEVACWVGEHKRMLPLATVSVLLYAVGIPVFFGIILFKNADRLHEGPVRCRFGAIFRLYK